VPECLDGSGPGPPVQAVGQVPPQPDGSEPEGQCQRDAEDDAERGRAEIHADDGGGGDHHGDRGVEAVAAEDGGRPAQDDIAQGAATDRGDGAQRDRREPSQSRPEGFVDSRDGPEAEDRRIESGEKPRPGLLTEADEEDHHGTGEGGQRVRVIGQCDGRAVLQQDIPDHASAQAGDESDHEEAEEVQTGRAGHGTAQKRAREHPGEVEDSRRNRDPLGNQGVRRHGHGRHADQPRVPAPTRNSGSGTQARADRNGTARWAVPRTPSVVISPRREHRGRSSGR
jgi:hypothetical protein